MSINPRRPQINIDIPTQNSLQNSPVKQLPLNECNKVYTKCIDVTSYNKIGHGAYGNYIYNPSIDEERGIKFSPKLAEEKNLKKLEENWKKLRDIIENQQEINIKNIFIIPENPVLCKNENGCVITYKTKNIKKENLGKYNDLNPIQKEKIKKQLKEALIILEKNNIYHNDLHPMNILIEKINEIEYEPRIIDWDLIDTSSKPSDAQINECSMYYDNKELGIDTCVENLLKGINTTGGGLGKKNKYLKIGNRYVYVGPRGGLYINVKGEMKLLKKLKVKK